MTFRSTRPHISIEWCTFPPIRDHWMDRCYMVFDIPPHNNKEVPLYILWNLYEEFVMGKHVNYFDMLGFQGVGRGMPQNRPNSRHRDANPQIPTPHSQLPRADIPPAHDMVSQTLEEFMTLTEMVSRHTNTIDQTTPLFLCWGTATNFYL